MGVFQKQRRLVMSHAVIPAALVIAMALTVPTSVRADGSVIGVRG